MKNKKRLHPEDVKLIRDSIISELKNLMDKNTSIKWMKSKEICELLGISNSKLTNMRNNRNISFSQIGKVYYYNVDDINKLLEQNKTYRLE